MKGPGGMRLAEFAAVVTLFLVTPTTAESELIVDYQRDNLTLNGKWLTIAGHEDEPIWRQGLANTIEGWQEVNVPGVLVRRTPKDRTRQARKAVRKANEADRCAWARRTFTLTEAQAARDAVLKWGGIRFGATVWINGERVTTCPTIGPHTAPIPRGVLKTGDNEIVIKAVGWAGLPKCAARPHRPLVPTGASVVDWGSKATSIYDDIYLEFYDRVYVAWVQAVPDLADDKVTFRVKLSSAAAALDELSIVAEISSAGCPSDILGQTKLNMRRASRRVDIGVSFVQAPTLWTPQNPHLYTGTVAVADRKSPCDTVSFRFGMREILVKDGHYYLNGKPLWLRGSNLVSEWRWGEPFTSQPKRYLVDEARAMNLNCFRTHTGPPPTSWCDVADENGVMILAEMPVLQNYQRFPFNETEYDVWHEHVLTDASAWITKLWNHPSIIMWVLSNETTDNKWEHGPYHQAVVALDPTRPTMRTGKAGEQPYGTPDNLDLHTCYNIETPPEGHLIETINAAAAGKDPFRTLSNSEYMNTFITPERRALLWLGTKNAAGLAQVVAEAAAEHTEAMRRAKFDCILPYMFAGWTGMRGANWRPGFPTRMAAALHSSMAPVLASLELFDRNFQAGTEVTTPLHLINELHEDVAATLDVYITPENPLVVPDPAALEKAVSHEAMKRTLDADGIKIEDLTWRVPAEAGVYYLAVVLRRSGDKPVVSQRVVRSIRPPDRAARLKGKRLLLLGRDQVISDYLRAGGADVRTELAWGAVKADAVVVCDTAGLGRTQRKQAPKILSYVRAGGRLVVLNQPKWKWPELLRFQITRAGAGTASRVFPYEDADHPMLAGIDPEYLKRWNGLPGTVCDARIIGKLLENCDKLLWQVDPFSTVAASMKIGKGEAIVCLLHLAEHIDREGPNYDPVAETLLLNLLSPTGG